MLILRGFKSKFLITRGFGRKLVETIIKLFSRFYQVITLDTVFKKNDEILFKSRFYQTITLKTKFDPTLFNKKILLNSKFNFNISLNTKMAWEKK